MIEEVADGFRGWLRRNRQVIAFCCLLLVITWSLFFWQTAQDRQRTLEDARNDINHLTLAFEDYVDLAVRGIDDVLRMTKTEYEDDGWVTPSIEIALKHALENPYINNCSIIGADGYPLFSSLTEGNSIYLGDRPNFISHKNNDDGNLFISPPDVGRISGKLSIYLSRRLSNPDGSFAGVVSINVRPEYFTKFFHDVNLEQGGIVRVVGRDGIIRASQYSGSHQEIGRNLGKGALVEALARSPDGQYFSDGRIFGTPRYFGYRTMRDYPLIVQVGQTKASILAPFEKRRQVYLTVAVAVSLFILFYSGLLLRTAERRHQAEMRYRALMDQSFDAIGIADPETHDIYEFNPRFAEMLGYTAADQPLKIYDILGISKEVADETVGEIRAKGSGPPAVRLAVAKDGRSVPVERVVSWIIIGGKRFILLSLRNLTKERLLEKEIAVDAALARRIQQALLPQPQPSPYADVRTFYRPLRMVSGDTFGLRWNAAGTILSGYLIDVSGHGLATALQTAALGVLLRQATEAALPPAGQLEWLNSQIPQYFQEEAFAAAIMFELDLTKSELRYAGGGITEFYLNGRRVLVPGRLLGLGPEGEYEEVVAAVRPGDVCCFLTDGLGEVIRGSDCLAGKSAAEIIAAFEAPAITEKLYDDASAICVEILRTAGGPDRQKKEPSGLPKA